MSVHTKKRLTKVSIGEEEFSIPTKEAKAILSLVKSVKKAHAMEDSVSWDKVYSDSYGDTPRWAVSLRGARSKENMSQKELSKKTGIPVTTISKYENGGREISEKQAKKLAKALKSASRSL